MTWRTPPEIAKELRCNVHTVLAWIRRGELLAHDLRRDGASRPRWRISDEDLQVFLLRRRSLPKVKVERRRKPKQMEIIEFIK